MELLKGEYSVGMILDPQNKILLQRKDGGHFFWPNYWSLFGGGMKNGESSLECLVREVKNESELVLSDIKLFSIRKFSEVARVGPRKDVLKRQGKANYFAARFNGDLSKISVGEGAGFSVFDEEEIARYNQLGLVIPYLYEAIAQFYKEIKEGTFTF